MSTEAKRSGDQHPTGRSDSPVGSEALPTVAGCRHVHIQEHVVLRIVSPIIPHQTQGAIGRNRQGGLKLVGSGWVVINSNWSTPFAASIRGFHQYHIAHVR